MLYSALVCSSCVGPPLTAASSFSMPVVISILFMHSHRSRMHRNATAALIPLLYMQALQRQFESTAHSSPFQRTVCLADFQPESEHYSQLQEELVCPAGRTWNLLDSPRVPHGPRPAAMGAAKSAAAAGIGALKVECREKVDVVVVGAGVSGLVAARELEKMRFSVVVLEGRSRVGGRLLGHECSQSGTHTASASVVGGSCMASAVGV